VASLCYHKGCYIRLDAEWEGDNVALMETCRPWDSNQGHTEYNAYTQPFHWTSVLDVKSVLGFIVALFCCKPTAIRVIINCECLSLARTAVTSRLGACKSVVGTVLFVSDLLLLCFVLSFQTSFTGKTSF
jgi:hypothetical protein